MVNQRRFDGRTSSLSLSLSLSLNYHLKAAFDMCTSGTGAHFPNLSRRYHGGHGGKGVRFGVPLCRPLHSGGSCTLLFVLS